MARAESSAWLRYGRGCSHNRKLRFSILLPTRNGGPFLRDALDSILGQDGDFEVVVGDNANEDQTAAVLAERARDQRLRIVRSDVVLTVTENWMHCLRAARGQYRLMIGDDDLLLPDFFERADAVLRRNGDPDCLTFDAYSYVAPGSFSQDASAMWSARHFDVRSLRPEREIPLDERRRIVKDMFKFRVRFPLNMQLTLFSAAAVAAVPGDFFRAPFPDHFALNSMLLRASRLVVAEDRLLVVGVSPKSFGHYFYGGQQASGVRYLGSGADFEDLIPGSELINSMHAWLLELRRVYPELASTEIDRWGYATRQVNHWYRQLEYGRASLSEVVGNARSLHPWEIATVMLPMIAYRVVRMARRRAAGRARTYITDAWPALRPTTHRTIAAFAASLSRP